MNFRNLPFALPIRDSRLLTVTGVFWLLMAASAPAQDNAFVSGLRLLPDSAAGVVRVPDVPALCVAWKTTNLSGITDDPALKPLLEANFGVSGSMWKLMDDRVGIRPKDLYEIATGEVVAAWMAYTNKRRPSALVVVTDVRGKEAEAAEIVERIDGDSKTQGATRKDVTRGGETVRIYTPKIKPGQLKIEQIVIALTKDRLIAADHDEVVFEVIDAIPEGGRPNMLESAELRSLVTSYSYDQLESDVPHLPSDWKNQVVEWFARPLDVGRIVRDVAQVDRGNQVKILDLLEEQGFDAVQAAGGIAVAGTETFDLLHRGYIHAPPVAGEPERYRLAARMLNFPNTNLADLPKWIPGDVASVTRINWKLEKAFWASETLVDAALDSDIFRPSIDGIRDDEEGPQIDIAKNVLPNLDDRLILLTDNTLPATIDSERLLLAIAIKDQQAITTAVRKAMEVEPDVFEIESIPGIQIWKVQRGEDSELEDEFFEDLGFEEDVEDEQKPLLNTWAIAVIPQGPTMDSAYLIFSSHVELLEKVARRMAEANPAAPIGDDPEIQELTKQFELLGSEKQAIQRLIRLRYSLRGKYELLRKGELKNSDSLLATVIRRALEGEEPEDELDRPNQAKWPPFAAIEKYFRNAVSYVETTEEGWTLNGFLLR